MKAAARTVKHMKKVSTTDGWIFCRALFQSKVSLKWFNPSLYL